MARYIDADILIKNGWRLERHAPSGAVMVEMSIADVPTADVAEVRHGEWVLKRQSNGVRVHKCSLCGRLIYTINEDLKDYAPYCHCGARMDG